MRSYCAVYVDVGYLLASAATRVTGSSLRRSIQVDYPLLVRGLIEQAESDSRLPLLRVNWYDSGARPGGRPDLEQEDIGILPRVKLRLGRRSYSGDQKGVDVRMGLDLAIQGRNHVADVIYLASGDDDLTEAVEEAQAHGIQVMLLAVPDHADRPHAVARHLQRAADGVLNIAADVIDASVRAVAIPEALLASAEGREATQDGAPASSEGQDPAPVETADDPAIDPALDPAPEPGSGEHAPQPTPVSSPVAPQHPVPSPLALAGKKATEIRLPTARVLDLPRPGEDGALTAELVDAVAGQVVATWCTSATPEMLADLTHDRPTVPGDLDRALLLDLSSRSGVYDLDDATRYAVRESFWRHVDQVRMV